MKAKAGEVRSLFNVAYNVFDGILADVEDVVDGIRRLENSIDDLRSRIDAGVMELDDLDKAIQDLEMEE